MRLCRRKAYMMFPVPGRVNPITVKRCQIVSSAERILCAHARANKAISAKEAVEMASTLWEETKKRYAKDEEKWNKDRAAKDAKRLKALQKAGRSLRDAIPQDAAARLVGIAGQALGNGGALGDYLEGPMTAHPLVGGGMQTEDDEEPSTEAQP